jgi:hypothetical protein
MKTPNLAKRLKNFNTLSNRLCHCQGNETGGTDAVRLRIGADSVEVIWHDGFMPKKKKKAQPPPKKNPTDPILLARSVLEAAIGEPLTKADGLAGQSSKKSNGNKSVR